ncbi:MAG: hypothetical protein ACI9MC_000894 [Kiritimatiellia bacterium]|jgi:hypothetical protein
MGRDKKKPSKSGGRAPTMLGDVPEQTSFGSNSELASVLKDKGARGVALERIQEDIDLEESFGLPASSVDAVEAEMVAVLNGLFDVQNKFAIDQIDNVREDLDAGGSGASRVSTPFTELYEPSRAGPKYQGDFTEAGGRHSEARTPNNTFNLMSADKELEGQTNSSLAMDLYDLRAAGQVPTRGDQAMVDERGNALFVELMGMPRRTEEIPPHIYAGWEMDAANFGEAEAPMTVYFSKYTDTGSILPLYKENKANAVASEQRKKGRLSTNKREYKQLKAYYTKRTAFLNRFSPYLVDTPIEQAKYNALVTKRDKLL